MIGLTREADGALRIAWLLGKTDAQTDAGTIAAQTSLSPKFALKILRKLSLGGVVTAQRGKNGGYRLAMAPKDISVRMLVELLDGPIAINRCCDASYHCSRMGDDKQGCSFHGLHRCFRLHQYDIAFLYSRLSLIDILRQQVGIGYRSHGNGVLTMAIHENKSHTRRVLLIHNHMLGVDTLGLVLVYRADTKGVVAHLGNEEHLASQTGCCHSLIGTLASGIHEKCSSKQRLSRQRKSFHINHHIGVATAYDYNFPTHIIYC
jgi:Rrf2 family protein